MSIQTQCTILLFMVVCFGSGCCNQGALKLDACVKNLYTNDARLYPVLKIDNQGARSETVLSANCLCSIGGSGELDDPFVLTYGLSSGRVVDAMGFKYVPSLCYYNPVSVQPGEYAEIYVAEPGLVAMLNSHKQPVYFLFRYDVSAEWGKRLNIWHGHLVSGILSIPSKDERRTERGGGGAVSRQTTNDVTR